MSEENKKVELKEQDLKNVSGGEYDQNYGWKYKCVNCKSEQWEYELGPGNTCRFCFGPVMKK